MNQHCAEHSVCIIDTQLKSAVNLVDCSEAALMPVRHIAVCAFNAFGRFAHRDNRQSHLRHTPCTCVFGDCELILHATATSSAWAESRSMLSSNRQPLLIGCGASTRRVTWSRLTLVGIKVFCLSKYEWSSRVAKTLGQDSTQIVYLSHGNVGFP